MGAPVPDYSWAPALLYDVISSPSPTAMNSLYDATFVTGSAIVPQLTAALADDRTASYAAQSLAFIGGTEALSALSKLVNDPRNLNLRRFYYGALGEFDTPQANKYLLYVLRHANNEPDRTVTEAALVALTVHSRADLIPQLKQIQATLTDPLIQDDLENAIGVIQARAQYLAVHKSPGGAIQDALNLYFEPALASAINPQVKHWTTGATNQAQTPQAKVEIHRLVFSPNRARALAHVVFTIEGESQRYRIVLQKQYGDWTVASVWLVLPRESDGGVKPLSLTAPTKK